MAWYTFPGWGTYELNGLAAFEINATGAHGYPTEAQAQAHPNASVSGAQAIILSGFKAASTSPVGAGSTGVLQTPSSTGGLGGALHDFLGGVSVPSLFLRVGEVLLGLVLLAVGVAKLTNAIPVATRVARAVS